METLVLEPPILSSHETDDIDDTEDTNADHFIISIGALSVESARNLVENLQNCAFTHTFTREAILTEKESSINFTESRYSVSEFHGIMIDTGTSQISTAGYEQYLALDKNLKTTLTSSTISTINVQFGIGSIPSFGSINLNTPVGLVVFYVVKVKNPFILCLKDMDSLGVYFKNFQNMLIQNENCIPAIRKFGHAFFKIQVSLAFFLPKMNCANFIDGLVTRLSIVWFEFHRNQVIKIMVTVIAAFLNELINFTTTVNCTANPLVNSSLQSKVMGLFVTGYACRLQYKGR